MRETAAELNALQELLDRSAAGAGAHLRGIVRPERRLTAPELVAALDGMRVLVLATVTAAGEPRTSCVDGHFLHGTWLFSTDSSAYKARHLARRPVMSATHVDGERLAVFTHGTVDIVDRAHPDYAACDEYFTEYYGSSPSAWGDVWFFRARPTFMIGFAQERAA